MGVHDRIKMVVKWLISIGTANNQEAIGRLMGYSNKSSFSQILNNKVPIPNGFINRLCALNGNINKAWIEKEVGEMVNIAMPCTDDTTPADLQPDTNQEPYKNVLCTDCKTHTMNNILSRIQEIAQKEGITIGSLERVIGASKGVLSRAISNGTDIQSRWIRILVENYPQYSTRWLLTGNGSMLRADDAPPQEPQPSINQEYKGAPYYSVDFMGGFELTLNDQTQRPDYYINYHPYNKEGVVWCNITGHSMEPKINHGDVIALKSCTLDDVQYGEIYAIVLDTIRTVKILRKSPDPMKLRFVPINTRDFDEQEFDKRRILKVYEVLGSISKFF